MPVLARSGQEQEGVDVSDENKATLRQVAEDVFNGRDLEKIGELFTEDYVMHDPNAPEEPRGTDGM